MTREMAIEIFKKQQSLCLRENDWYKALTMAIEALQMESCEDAISRQAVIEQTYNWSKDEFLRTTNAFDHLRRKIKVLPPVQLPNNIIRCKECRFYTNFQKGKPWNVLNKYCNRVVTIKTSPDDFCSFAQAKVGDAESECEPDIEELDFIPPRRIVGKMISADVLDKIRSEIEQNAYSIVHGVNNHELGMTLYGILQVIDKYMEESEDEK